MVNQRAAHQPNRGLLAGQGVPLERIQELPYRMRARLRDATAGPTLLCVRLTRKWETVRGCTARIRRRRHPNTGTTTTGEGRVPPTVASILTIVTPRTREGSETPLRSPCKVD